MPACTEDVPIATYKETVLRFDSSITLSRPVQICVAAALVLLLAATSFERPEGRNEYCMVSYAALGPPPPNLLYIPPKALSMVPVAAIEAFLLATSPSYCLTSASMFRVRA